MSDPKTTKFIDRLKDERRWVDLVGLVYYMAGQHDAKIPVEWGRTRIIKFLKKKQAALQNSRPSAG